MSSKTLIAPLIIYLVTYSIVAGSVDNVDLLEVIIQEVPAYGQDITAATIVLFHCHGLRQPRSRHRCTAVQKQENEKKTGCQPKEEQIIV